MARKAAKLLLDGRGYNRGTAIPCSPCSDHFGQKHIMRVTILPTSARRQGDGIVLNEIRPVCADCLARGVTTPAE